MSQHVDTTLTVADARHELCHRLAQAIREGEVGMQVRFVRSGETIKDLWIYTKRHHEWTKRDDLAIAIGLADPLKLLMEGLAKQEFSDAWTCHHTDHPDRIDFELKFSREAIEPHITSGLESYLNGCLAHDHHDSGQDSRRRIRFQGR